MPEPLLPSGRMEDRLVQAGGPDADVGGWFRTAGVEPQPGRVVRWGPGAGYGRSSGPEVVDAALRAFAHRPTMFLTGAGISTASGLPDYRGQGARVRHPMTYQEFVGSDVARRHYWARSFVGWHSFRRAVPNESHTLLARLQDLTPMSAVVTQNVDGLHQLAGSRDVIDLHGSLARVTCLGCGHVVGRDRLQEQLLGLNPGFAARLEWLSRDADHAPDGDAVVDRTGSFEYPACESCGGMLKPDVVFFGENADPSVVNRAFEALERSEALVVLGTSLTVMSGLRFVRRAARDGLSVVIVNDGDTRGDEHAVHRIHGRLSPVLGRWREALSVLKPA